MLCWKKLHPKQFFRRNNTTIAIDIGASTSVVCVLEDGQPKVIENIEGERTTPAFIAFEDEDVVGITARRQALLHPQSTVYGFHGLIGLPYNEEALRKMNLNYKVAKGSEGKVAVVDAKGQLRSVEQVTSILMKRMKETAESNLGKEVSSALIGVPSYFKEEELKTLTEAAALIGLKIDNFVPEPVAALLAYGFGQGAGSKRVLVFDLGGRGLDVTLVDVLGSSVQISATAREDGLGGEAFDAAFIEYIAKEFQDKEKLDLTNNALAQQKLKNAAEVAKCELSTSMNNEINIPYIAADATGPKHLLVKISRAKLEAILEPLIQKTLEPIKTLLESSKLAVGDIDDVVIVGGQAKTPRIAETLETFFGKPVFKPTCSPDEAVALGLHLYKGGAAGAEAFKFPAMPLMLGVEVFGRMVPIVDFDAKIPLVAKRLFSTANDNQTEADIKILMGASPFSANNETLCRVGLTNLPPSLQRELLIEVTVEINEDCDVTITVRELTLMTEAEPVVASVRSLGGLSQDRALAIREAAKTAEGVEAKHKELAEREAVLGQLVEIEKIVYACRALLGESERNKLLKPLLAFKNELETGAPLYPPKQAKADNSEATSQNENTQPATHPKIEALQKALTLALHNAAKEDQKRLLNYE